MIFVVKKYICSTRLKIWFIIVSIATNYFTGQTMMVYCKFCKYLENIVECRHPSNLLAVHSWYEPKQRTKESPNRLNENNDCPNFVDISSGEEVETE